MTDRSVNPRHGKYRYTSTQVRAVLASRAPIAQAAAEAEVSVAAAAQWRTGNLPKWFEAEQEQERAAVQAARASRFVNPRDARAGR